MEEFYLSPIHLAKPPLYSYSDPDLVSPKNTSKYFNTKKFSGNCDFFFESTNEFSEYIFLLVRSDLLIHIRDFGGKIVICYLNVPAFVMSVVLNRLQNLSRKLFSN